MVLAEFKCEQLRQHLAERATRIAEQATDIAELEVSSAPRLEFTCHFQVSLAMAVEQGHSWRDCMQKKLGPITLACMRVYK